MYFHYLLWNTKVILVNDFKICYFAKKFALNRLFLTEINILPPDLPPGASKKVYTLFTQIWLMIVSYSFNNFNHILSFLIQKGFITIRKIKRTKKFPTPFWFAVHRLHAWKIFNIIRHCFFWLSLPKKIVMALFL